MGRDPNILRTQETSASQKEMHRKTTLKNERVLSLDELCKNRSLFIWKETYVQRPVYEKRGNVCISRSRLAYVTEKQLWRIHTSSRSTSSAKTGLFSCGKRPMYMERDLCTWKEIQISRTQQKSFCHHCPHHTRLLARKRWDVLIQGCLPVISASLLPCT